MARHNRNVQSVKDNLEKSSPVLDKIEIQSLVKAFTSLLLAKVRNGSMSAYSAPQFDLAAYATKISGHCPPPLSDSVAPDPCGSRRGSDQSALPQPANRNVAVASGDGAVELMAQAAKSASHARRGLLSICSRLCKNQGRTACPVCHGEGFEQHQARVNNTHRGNKAIEITS